MNRTFRLLLFFLFLSLFSSAQRLHKADREMIARLQSHITYLASDKLEGRKAGTEGEKLAREYISRQFQQIGLEPLADAHGWYQSFTIDDGLQVNPATLFIVNGHDMKLNDEFFPLVISPDTSLETVVAMALAERGVPWFYDLKEDLEQNAQNPHFDLESLIAEKANNMAEKGASALILYNSSDIGDHLRFNGREKPEKARIPVLYLTPKAVKEYFSDESAMLDIHIKTDIGKKTRTGHNVIGYIDNHAPSTIIFGAHYDHLGFKEEQKTPGSLPVKEVYNGADDNASGTAALIELARTLKSSREKKNNYLFIAFSGEESGLLGSRYFTEHPDIDLAKANYMINMDMVGRMNSQTKALIIGGYGTSPSWGQVLPEVKEKKYLSVTYDSSGTGPSDHTSFYLKDIPVLFFFTGLHNDYHQPGDDAGKINYTGEWRVIRYILDLVRETGNAGKLAFTKTREQPVSTAVHFPVTLGIMPDYSFAGSGLRIDAVMDGRPAQKAGLKAGDIILQLGEVKTNSLETYMQALSRFRKGDEAMVRFKRGEEEKEAPIKF